MGLPGIIGPTAEKRYSEEVWKELQRVGWMLNYHHKQMKPRSSHNLPEHHTKYHMIILQMLNAGF